MRAGRSFPDNMEAILFGFGPETPRHASKLPMGNGFSIEFVQLAGDGLTWVALTRSSGGRPELFVSLANDVMDVLSVEAEATDARLMLIFVERVRAWQDFMRRGTLALAAEAEMGLVGELCVLDEMLSLLRCVEAISSWVGPLDGVQDFALGAGAIEVKSSLSATGFPARIGSLEQLDDSIVQPLFVAVLRFGLAADGTTLPELVDRIRARVGSDPEAERLLGGRLLAAGYYEGDRPSYERRFLKVEQALVEVGPGFPRLTIGSVPSGVTRAMYEIEIQNAPGRRVDLAEAVKNLGAV